MMPNRSAMFVGVIVALVRLGSFKIAVSPGVKFISNSGKICPAVLEMLRVCINQLMNTL